MGNAIRKCVFRHRWTTMAQISPRIRAVWSGLSLSADRTMEYYTMFQRKTEESKMSGWDFAHAHDDVNPHILRMLEGTFSPVAAQITRWLRDLDKHGRFAAICTRDTTSVFLYAFLHIESLLKKWSALERVYFVFYFRNGRFQNGGKHCWRRSLPCVYISLKWLQVRAAISQPAFFINL